MNLQESDNPYLGDELIIVRDSGEIPEVALHGSIYFLTRDPDGPCLDLEETDLRLLKKTAAARYREIIRRDLEPENRDKSLYRGLARCIANWHRMERFCRRENIDTNGFRKEVKEALLSFLERELNDLADKSREPSVNCTWKELCQFSLDLGINPRNLPKGVQKICPEGD